MPIRKYNPTTPGRRGMTSLTFDEITTDKPHGPLTEKLQQSGGRNNTGEQTIWWRGGGHKRLYASSTSSATGWHPRHGRDDRVRPEPVGPHCADQLRRWQKRYILQPVG